MGNVCACEKTADEKPELVNSKAVVGESDTASKEGDETKEADASKEADAPKKGQEMIVTIVGARGLRDSDWLPGAGKPDCYVEVKSLDRLLHTTEVISNTCEPVWAEERPMQGEGPLEFAVYDKDAVGSDFLGKATLEAKDYELGYNGELQLQDAKVPQAYLRVKVKMPDRDLPPGPAAEYTVTVEKQAKKESYGMRLDHQDPKRLTLLEVQNGPFSRHNANAKPEDQVKANDFIVSVNSATDSAGMLSEFGSSLKVECKFKRCMPVSIVFDRGDTSTPLGLKMPVKFGSSCSILVMSVASDSAVAKHNEAAKEHERICAGDRILAVGATRGPAMSVKKALEGVKGQVQLTVLKPAVSRSDDGDGYTFGHWFFG